jgi:UDP-N-acetylglucosamine--N-acetylmuramyl-(pentapeptide) pyrophosphoryl-undecaprenol N-acetylglucosamine transferase
MKIVVVGGHLSPALAVIERLKGEIFYIGRKYALEGDKAISLEYQEIVKLGIPFFSINAARFQRKFTKHTIPAFSKFPLGLIQSAKILKTIKPDVVLAFGGYLSLPVVLSSYFLRVPVVIHEQTLEAGFANKLEARIVNKICISWPSSQKYFPKNKTILTGNPIKQEVMQAKDIKQKNKMPIILITGGSSGSHAINRLVEDCLEKLLKRFIVFHQTGAAQEYNDFQKFKDKKDKDKQIFKNYHPEKFFTSKKMAEVMARADLIVGRSGINTVSELIFLQKPAFLIPLPFAQGNEQMANAMFLKDLGLAEVAEQGNLPSEIFSSTISRMLKNINNYKLKENVLIENAADRIIKIIKDVSAQKTV